MKKLLAPLGLISLGLGIVGIFCAGTSHDTVSIVGFVAVSEKFKKAVRLADESSTTWTLHQGFYAWQGYPSESEDHCNLHALGQSCLLCHFRSQTPCTQNHIHSHRSRSDHSYSFLQDKKIAPSQEQKPLGLRNIRRPGAGHIRYKQSPSAFHDLCTKSATIEPIIGRKTVTLSR